MKKIFTLISMIFAFSMGAMAQEVTFDFTSVDNPWDIPSESTKDEGSFTYNGYTIKLAAVGTDGYKLSNVTENKEVVSKYILLGKQGATLTFPAFSFDVEKIEIVGRAGASTGVKQNIFVGDDAVSTETTGATGTNSYLIKKENQAAGNVYVLKVTSKHNTQITQIKIYKASGVSAPEISGEEVFCGSTQVTITADEGAQIYYTTDGNDPTASDALYAGPFTLDKSATVKAVAAKGDALSSVVSKVFTKTVGEGSETNPFTVADVLSLPASYSGTGKWVKGFIVGSVKNAGALEETPETATNIAIADAAGETEWAKISCVALPTGDIRTALNIVDNPTNVGKQVKVCGSIMTYFGNMGVKDITAYELGTAGVDGIATEATTDANAPMYNLAGQRVSKAYKGVVIQNGRKFIVK